MSISAVPVYVTLPVGCDKMQLTSRIDNATANETLWSSSGWTVGGSDGNSIQQRTGYYNCMGDEAAIRFAAIVTANFPGCSATVGEPRRYFRNGLIYRLHTYDHGTGPSHEDFVFKKGPTPKSPPSFRPVGSQIAADPIKCKAVKIAAPGLVGEAAIFPDGGMIFAAHEVAASKDNATEAGQ